MRKSLIAMDRQLGRLAGLFAVISAGGIVVLLAVTVIAVFWRYVLNAPIFGIEDLSIVALTVVAAGSVAYGGREGAHVSIDLLGRFLDRGLIRITDAFMRAATAGISFLAAYALVVKACGFEKACITSNLSIEHRPFYYVLAAALALYGLNTGVQLLKGLVIGHESSDSNEAQD